MPTRFNQLILLVRLLDEGKWEMVRQFEENTEEIHMLELSK